MDANKRCKFCGSKCAELRDFDALLPNSVICCDKCNEIQTLQNLIKDYCNKCRLQDNNIIHDRNIKKSALQPIDCITIYSSCFHRIDYRIEGRTNFIQELIDKIDYVRKILSMEVAAQFEILDSIYRQDIFWKESGDLTLYVHNASIEYIVIKLKEMLKGCQSKYSIEKLKNIFTNDKKRIFGNYKVFEVFEYESGDTFETEYKPFPIVEYLDKIDTLLKEYSKLIAAISDFRDNQCAHIGKLKEESSNYLTYTDIKRIYSMIKTIYDGFFLAVAPDKFVTPIVEHNIWFSNLNKIVKEYKENRYKRIEN